MRIFFFLVANVLHLAAIGQKTTIELPIDDNTKQITFSDVIPVQANKAKIFSLLRSWATSNSQIKDKTVAVADTTTGELVVNCQQPIFAMGISFCSVKYTITFYIKDGKYKSLIRGFNHLGCNRGAGYGNMPSYGPLESMLDVSKDRMYLDHILQATKDHAIAVQDSFKSYSLTAKNEKDF